MYATSAAQGERIRHSGKDQTLSKHEQNMTRTTSGLTGQHAAAQVCQEGSTLC